MSEIIRHYRYNGIGAVMISRRDLTKIIVESDSNFTKPSEVFITVIDDLTMCIKKGAIIYSSIENKADKNKSEISFITSYLDSRSRGTKLMSYRTERKIGMDKDNPFEDIIRVKDLDIWLCRYQDRETSRNLDLCIEMDTTVDEVSSVSIHMSLVDSKSMLKKKFVNIMGSSIPIKPIISSLEDGLYIKTIVTDRDRAIVTNETYLTIEQIITDTHHMYDSKEEAEENGLGAIEIAREKLQFERDVLRSKIRLEKEKNNTTAETNKAKIKGAKQDQINHTLKALLVFAALCGTTLTMIKKNAQANE